MKLPRLDPEKAYLGASLFLPYNHVAEGPIRGALTFGLDRNNEPRVLVKNHPHHLEVPRGFLSRKEIEEELGIEVVDLRTNDFAPSSLRVKPGFTLRAKQQDAWAVLKEATGGVIQLPCGAGKTILGLYKAAHFGKATLIISPQGAHLDNWEAELQDHFELDGPVGRVGDGKMDFEREVVLATVQTIALRAESGDLPPEFLRRFGTILYDECHHMSAELYVKSADICMGNRFGLTATPKRTDRNEGIFFSHIGPLLYSDTSQDLIPEVEVIELPTSIPEADLRSVSDRSGQRNLARLRTWLARNNERNHEIRVRLDQAIAEGRTIYALTHVVEHAKALHAEYPDSSLITGETPSDERLKELNRSKLVFATYGVATEAYNRKDLDSLFLLTPLAADKYAGAPQLTQAIGRIQRAVPGKPTPEVIVLLDRQIPECAGLTFGVISFLKSKNYPFRSTQWNNRRPPRGF